MKTQFCDECENFKYIYSESDLKCDTLCSKMHKPRFYKPKGYMDNDHGWKRKCADFKMSERVIKVQL